MSKINQIYFFQYFNVACEKSKSTEKSTLINIYSPFFGEKRFFFFRSFCVVRACFFFLVVKTYYVTFCKFSFSFFFFFGKKYPHAESQEKIGRKNYICILRSGLQCSAHDICIARTTYNLKCFGNYVEPWSDPRELRLYIWLTVCVVVCIFL